MTSRQNILLLSAGRRVSLARAFREVARNYDVRFLAADLNPQLSAACQDNGDYAALPNVASYDYPAALADLCRRESIGLVVPTIDTELSLLAGLRDSFQTEGTTIAVSSESLIAIARDKRRTAEHFAAIGVSSPTIYPNDRPSFPAIAKPFDGSLSRHVRVLHNGADHAEALRTVPNLMIADYLDPNEHDEFTCDAYFDRAQSLRCIVPRKRIEIRGGEVAKGITLRNNIVMLFETTLATLPGARGCLTFQLFRNRTSGALSLIELNARFGGGFPLSLAAGANYPRWLYEEWVLGCSLPYFAHWEDGLTMLRFDEAVLVPKQENDG